MNTATIDRAGLTEMTKDVNRLTSAAINAASDARRVVERAVKRGIYRVEDFRDESLHRVRRHPAKAVGLAMSVGAIAGFVAGWASFRRRRRPLLW
jgi:hypothetical protein